MFSLFLLCFYLVNGILVQSLTIVETAQATPSLSTLVTVLTTAGYEPLLEALSGPGTFTVFAPNNDAFAKAGLDLADVEKNTATILMHVLGSVVMAGDLVAIQFPETLSVGPRYVNLAGKGQRLFITKERKNVYIYYSNVRAQVVLADVVCSNGVVHVIDEVIMLPPVISKSILYSGLNTLSSAINKAGLGNLVDTTPGITIFAPSDTAFRLAGIVVDDTPVDTLVAVLSNHVVTTSKYTTDIVDGETLTSLGGGTLTLRIDGGQYYVNNAQVRVDNVLVRNGVAHFIDQVLLPSKLNITQQ
jgi:uncharacterized surface protein with fasciclin (FAS1) repeats